VKPIETDEPVDSFAPSDEPAGVDDRRQSARTQLGHIARSMKDAFESGRRVLSFGEYLDLFASHPARFGRSAAEYVRDMFAFYGTEEVSRPWGERTRFRLFDAPWQTSERGAPREPELVGHEDLQAGMYRAFSNFAREGQANRLVLMHGPNGSAKSTAAACVLRALEHYSQEASGALYRFHWIFPSRHTSRGSIGFSGGPPTEELETFAHLDDDDVDARLVMELRDHPMFLIPGPQRRVLLDELWGKAELASPPSDWLATGELSHKNKQIFEALLTEYDGSLEQVLRHVQVERYFISQRYRIGAVTVGPEMSVDASERQVTADRSLSALPKSLQSTTLFEAHGELVEASGGVLEFSDLLKRPIDAFRYLQISLETGQVSLSQQTLFTNVVMIGSANEIHMAAFREHPEYASFRGRLELQRVAYLRDYHAEQQIYDTQILPQLRGHVAPHTTTVAAEFAVLSRMLRPDPSEYEGKLKEVVDSLTAIEKMDLYADGITPDRLSTAERRLLKASIELIYRESLSDVDYEGRVGVSPRVMRTSLLDASQNADYSYVSPFALLKGLDELCKRASEFDWLKLKPLSGGYHDHESFRKLVRDRLMDRLETDIRGASGLIDDEQYADLFRRYIKHVSFWLKKEKIRNTVTGKDEESDEGMMTEVETLLEVKSEPKEHRDMIISMIAAWAIDNPGLEPNIDEIFPDHVRLLRSAAFERRRKPFAALLRDVVTLLRDDGSGLTKSRRKEAEAMVMRMEVANYQAESTIDAITALVRDRYADLVN
jgi:serine protein kinase